MSTPNGERPQRRDFHIDDGGEEYPMERMTTKPQTGSGTGTRCDKTEMILLGTMLFAPSDDELVGRMRQKLPAGAFAASQHRTIARAIYELDEQGVAISNVSVTQHLEREGKLGNVGGAFYLTQLTEKADVAGNAHYHALIIAESAMKRRMVQHHKQMAHKSQNGEDVFSLHEEDKTFQAGIDASIAAQRGDSDVGLLVSDVERERIRWLWPGRLALGKITGIDGNPGVGKSMLYCDLAARITTGRPFPGEEGKPTGDGAGVVIVTTEDSISDTIRPRLEAAGADLSRVNVVKAVPDDSPKAKMHATHDEKTERVPVVPHDLPLIERALESVDARLIVFDPITAHLPEECSAHNDADVRRAMGPLANMAERLDIAVMCIRHLNKQMGASPMMRGGGSIAFTALYRACLALGLDPQEPERRVLAPIKGNASGPVSSQAFHLEESDKVDDMVRIQWDGAVMLSASEIIASPDRRGRPSEERDEAKAFLEDLLGDAPRRATTVYEEA